jgi:hypothetical protein
MIYFMYFYKFIKIKIIILCPYFALSSMISSQSHKLCSFELLRIIAHSAFFVDDYYMMHSYEVPSWIPRDMIDHLTCLSSIHEEGSTILLPKFYGKHACVDKVVDHTWNAPEKKHVSSPGL